MIIRILSFRVLNSLMRERITPVIIKYPRIKVRNQMGFQGATINIKKNSSALYLGIKLYKREKL